MDDIHTTFERLFKPTVYEGRVDCKEIRDFSTRWGLYQSLYTLCDEDITRLPKVLQANLYDSLTLLLYKKDKNYADFKQMKFDEQRIKSSK